MDMEARKYRLIEKLMEVNEENTLYKLEQLLVKGEGEEAWNKLPAEAKTAIENSLLESTSGKTTPASHGISKIKDRYIGS